MTKLELEDEKEINREEYKALKSVLADLILEHQGHENPEDYAYYSRKYEDARKKLGRK